MTVPVMNGIRLMTDDDVVQLLETRFGDAGTARLIDGCARAVAGVSEDGRIIYDYGRLVELFMSHEGMDEGTAAEYVDFNIVGGIAHLERAPILMYPVDWHDGAPDGPEEEWWYGTETLFVNGRHCLSKVMFDPYPIGEPPKGMVKVPAGGGAAQHQHEAHGRGRRDTDGLVQDKGAGLGVRQGRDHLHHIPEGRKIREMGNFVVPVGTEPVPRNL